ncbi:MAG: sigma-70 family RNA polymerase sigma factor [Verrucomicrobia bacterium]|nr:sigma-70 family RNA polymerase sigma factor [Verrucomicrobiota bacterium]
MVIADDRIEMPDTRALLARAQEGDAASFGRLLLPLEARLLRQAVALCNDPAAAEDLVSETLIEAWKSLRRYDETCRFSTWLYAILLHRYQKCVRRALCRPIPLAWLPFFDAEKHLAAHENQPADGPSPAGQAEQHEQARELRRAVARLSRKHREVILLRFFEDASLPDMASVLGCSVGTVKSRLHHALEKLRRMNLNLSPASWDTQT